MADNENGVFVGLLFFAALFAGLLTAEFLNIQAGDARLAEASCKQIKAHLVEFDRSGEAVCDNGATLNYK